MLKNPYELEIISIPFGDRTRPDLSCRLRDKKTGTHYKRKRRSRRDPRSGAQMKNQKSDKGMLPIKWRSIPPLNSYRDKYRCSFDPLSHCCFNYVDPDRN
ncbi:MAG: hypothetical protein QNJ54_22330 [Prochloraceae cyanobacterium]|nr:hypothetical protein [Prochloraceae cyanobacterium]